MAAVNFVSNLENAASQFRQSSAQTQLVVLYYVAKKIHKTSKMATPSAFFSQKVNEFLKQIQQMPKGDRHEALEEILHSTPTRLAEAYEGLDTNMRMAFWFRLATSRRDDALLPAMFSGRTSQAQESLLANIEVLDSNELIAFLKAAVEAQPTRAF